MSHENNDFTHVSVWRYPILWIKQHFPDKPIQRVVVVGAMLLFLVVMSVIYLTYHSSQTDAHVDAQGKTIDNQGKTIDALQGALAKANSKLTSVGVAPVTPTIPVPSPSPGPSGPQGAIGPAPSIGSIEIAVDAYCSLNTCGIGPTATQVAQAVSTFCSANGECKGASGSNGSTGAPGESGPQGPTGPQGPSGADGQNVTAQQVADAVGTYCAANNGCAGPTGPSGQPGEPPFSWTYTTTLGVQHTCSRTDPFDKAAPTYTCS